MKRRALLGSAAGALAATAGCLDALPVIGEERPLTLRTARVEPKPADADPADVTWPTNVTCQLPDEFVGAHPELERALREASDRPVNDWVTADITQETGDDIVLGLEANCATTGGLNFYRGEAYWISIRFKSEEAAAAHHDDGHNHTSG